MRILKAVVWLTLSGCSQNSPDDVKIESREDAEAFLTSIRCKVKQSGIKQILPIASKQLKDEQLVFAKFYPDANYLYAGKNQIRGEGLKHLSKCSMLERISLHSNPLNDDGLKHLSIFPALTRLSLDRTKITSEGCRHLESLTNLTELMLADTDIDDKAITHFRHMAALQKIYLTGTGITKDGVEELLKLPSVQYLYLSRTDLGDDVIPIITAARRKLHVLYLSGTRITDAGLERLTRLDALGVLNISDTEITESGIASLVSLPIHTLRITGTDLSPTVTKWLGRMRGLERVWADPQLVHSAEFQELRTEKRVSVRSP